MKNIVLTVFILLVISCFAKSNSQKIEEKRAICTNDNISIYDSIDNPKSIGTLNTGDILIILEESSKFSEAKNGNFKWIKIKYNNINGWVLSAYLSLKFFYDQEQDILIFSELIDSDGASNPYNITILSRKDKKIMKYPVNMTDYFISDTGKYIAIDKGSSILGILDIYSLPDFRKLYSFIHNRERINWEKDKFIFKKCLEYDINGIIHYDWEELIFDNGQINSTGKTGKF
jgi:hypothetical protein